MVYVLAELSFIADDPRYEREKPYDIVYASSSDPLKSNCQFATSSAIRITDCRSKFEEYNLKHHGFAFLLCPSSVSLRSLLSEDVDTAKEAVQPYLKGTIAIAREELKPERVICFDWRIRKRSVSEVNVSHDGGRVKLHRHLSSDEIAKVTDGEWEIQFVNVWRPISEVVKDAPLTLCDPSSVARDDLPEVDKVHTDHVEESAYLKQRPHREW
ncbi:uncharacterized protein BDZ99DRAFT_479386 [Mytilinidion resinicola]|uniref:Uncharacterized protein n=1 Tax=Mytilinidion resinicola TaxID=574789 RepID=A0A6A6YES6_9PEZI|nr:uncharacterized protein BDZ99DRAFT_479386 [Mytilinidion resinicola]KAF2807033.1 hypothetical protein BDZ99DRAFT_479386 [Mytilinidion resinicola]